MPTDPIHLIGAGGHALVVIDALLAGGVPKDAIRLYDQDAAKIGTDRLGIAVLLLNFERLRDQRFHVCIGDNATRIVLGEAASQAGGTALSIIHPAGSVSPTANIGAGCFVAAQAVVAPLADMGAYTIVNHGAVMDHDCRAAIGCHIAPGAILGGGVTLGRAAMVGAGATILPGISVAENATIGAGAVVVRNVGPGTVQVGVPARDISKR